MPNDLTLRTPEPKGDLPGLKFLPRTVARELACLPERDEVRRECQAMIRAAEPAHRNEFALLIERLALHYPENRLSAQEQKLVNEDWLRLLGHLPPDILRASVDRYVMSPARFFPTPGQLFALAEGAMGTREILAKRARETLQLLEGK
jgi:hypothetical protein